MILTSMMHSSYVCSRSRRLGDVAVSARSCSVGGWPCCRRTSTTSFWTRPQLVGPRLYQRCRGSTLDSAFGCCNFPRNTRHGTPISWVGRAQAYRCRRPPRCAGVTSQGRNQRSLMSRVLVNRYTSRPCEPGLHTQLGHVHRPILSGRRERACRHLLRSGSVCRARRQSPTTEGKPARDGEVQRTRTSAATGAPATRRVRASIDGVGGVGSPGDCPRRLRACQWPRLP